jgi:hypothetical protein
LLGVLGPLGLFGPLGPSGLLGPGLVGGSLGGFVGPGGGPAGSFAGGPAGSFGGGPAGSFGGFCGLCAFGLLGREACNGLTALASATPVNAGVSANALMAPSAADIPIVRNRMSLALLTFTVGHDSRASHRQVRVDRSHAGSSGCWYWRP